jgi:hypothetical protein
MADCISLQGMRRFRWKQAEVAFPVIAEKFACGQLRGEID